MKTFKDFFTESLWANINAKKKRGGKSARKGSKAYKAAKKAGDKLNKTKHSDEEHAAVFAKIDQDASNGLGKAELEGIYGAEVVAAYIADGEATGKFEGGIEDAESKPGRVKRAGASCKGSVTELSKRAKRYGGEKGKMYQWCLNMKRGKKK
ncbi:hypothetical protein N9Z65_01125 [bacterium]|nr:hypothetical protein [bacterium]